MASERHFRETLCEGRSSGVETTDPTGARTIDELRRVVKELRGTLEGEKQKNRQLVREHEKQVQHLREEEARRLDTSLEACAMRKEQEKMNELKKLEERLKKQNDHNLRQLAKEKADEFNKNMKKWNMEKNEAIRVAVEVERRQSLEDAHASFAEEEALAREDKLTREVFMLGEQNNVLEEQVKNLSRLNRAQIDQMRRIKQECDLKIENFLRQHKVEASREMAQLKLAEQIIAEKDHDLKAVSYRADMAMMEKSELEEELAAVKTSFQDTPQHESTPSRRSTGGTSSLKRLDELEALVKKLEAEKAGLKQENASIRKKLHREDAEKKSGTKTEEEKLRKKNSELVASNKELEDKIRLLKSEMQKGKATFGDSDQNARKALARQHAKDLSEHTKQIYAKDREIAELKKKTLMLEATVLTHSEPSPELEKKVKFMAMEKLKMERLIAKLYSRLPDVVNTEDFSQKDLAAAAAAADPKQLEQLMAENQALQSRVQALEKEVSHDKGVTKREAALQQEKEELLGEIDRLKDLSQSASKLESECISLRQSRHTLESSNAALEQRCHELSQQLKISTLAVRELESSQDASEDLQREVTDLREQLEERNRRTVSLEQELNETSAQLEGKQAIIDALQKQVQDLESVVQGKEEEKAELQASLESAQAEIKPSVETIDVGVQSQKPQETSVQPDGFVAPKPAGKPRPESPHKRFSKDRIRSPVRRGLRSHSPKTSSGDLMDTSLDNEMRAAGVDFNDSFDSSEGVGFSDTNIDTSAMGSEHSLAMREEGGDSSKPNDPASHRTAWMEVSDQAQATTDPVSTPTVNGGAAPAVVQDGAETGAGGVEEEVAGSEQSSDLLTDKAAIDSDESHTPQSDNYKVGVYIAKFSYNPSEMSPNQNFDLELPLTAGDYLYVYGDMDDDGYYHGQLLTGQSGMVPSNFIEKVADEEDEDDAHPPSKPHRKQSSLLQDIEEVDEEVSSAGAGLIPPPSALSLEKQFVEGGMYTIALQWKAPQPLPEGATGYSVYVNGECNCDVDGPTQTGVLLTGIPRQQLVKISVRTTTEEGESPDPTKLVILNPQYPEPPTGIQVTRSSSPACLMVHWTPSKPLKEGNPISGYTVFLNNHSCIQLGSNPTPVKSVCAQVFANDMKGFKDVLLKASVVLLTVCARSQEYLSAPSLPVVVSREDLQFVCAGGKMTADESEITSSATSLSSIEDEEEKEVYSPGTDQIEEEIEVQEVMVEDVPVSNGVTNSPAVHEGNGHGETVPVAYYRALASYDPQLQSPNEDSAEEELGFMEMDIIIGLEPMDVDGFIFAKLNGRTGYIPSNLVQEITDEEELSRIDNLLQEQSSQQQQRSINGNQRSVDEHATQRMRALFDYDPAHDSPNENSEVELAINEGDVVTVFGKPDGDGFFKAEVAGKKGLIPYNFLEDMSPPRNDGIEVFAADEESMRIADSIIRKTDIQTSPTRTWKSEKAQKRKGGGLLSRGKSLLSKSLGKQQRGGE